MVRAARTRLSAQERERELLHAATKVFARSNYRVAGTADIAREGGVSEPMIYKHFPSKQALFLRILQRIGERIPAIWTPVAAAETGDSLAALRRIRHVYFDSLRTHADELKVQFQALAESDDPAIARQLRENHKAYVRFFARLIQRGQREGVIRADVDPYAAGWLLNGVGFTLTLVRVLGFDQSVGERRITKMMDFCLDALTSPKNRADDAR